MYYVENYFLGNNTEWKLNNRITLTSGNMSWKYVGIHESNTKKQLFWQACPITQDLKVMINSHSINSQSIKTINLRLLCCTKQKHIYLQKLITVFFCNFHNWKIRNWISKKFLKNKSSISVIKLKHTCIIYNMQFYVILGFNHNSVGNIYVIPFLLSALSFFLSLIMAN